MLSEEQRKLVEDNINLVFYYLHKYRIPMDQCDIGYIALCKAALTYKPNKGWAFSTYALRIIQNDYLALIRNMKKVKFEQSLLSLDTPLTSDTDKELCLLDTIHSNFTIERELFMQDLYNNLSEFMSKLSYRQEVILTDFLNEVTQKETGKKIGFSQAQVSRVLKSLLSQFRKEYYPDIHIKDIEEMI